MLVFIGSIPCGHGVCFELFNFSEFPESTYDVWLQSLTLLELIRRLDMMLGRLTATFARQCLCKWGDLFSRNTSAQKFWPKPLAA